MSKNEIRLSYYFGKYHSYIKMKKSKSYLSKVDMSVNLFTEQMIKSDRRPHKTKLTIF